MTKQPDRARARWLWLGATLLVLVLAPACGRPGRFQSAAVEVTAVYPSGDLLPANQLKLYLEFSGPMTTRRPYDHLRLVDEATGEELDAVFHAMRDGLWDPEARRLTVLFDPGRIKRGLANHEALGLPLEAGRSYRLELSGDWPDAYGRTLSARYVKRFRAGVADRDRPSITDWSIDAPEAGSLNPLVIDFGEPLDAALLGRAFEIAGPAGAPVAFEVRLGRHEASCELWPSGPWQTGAHELEIDRRLEDLAGNNLERLFDADRTAAPHTAPQTRLRFDVVEPAATPLVADLHAQRNKETP